jgi:hypothetical protein
MSLDELIGFIFFVLVFLAGPIIEHLRRKQQPPPPQRRPMPPQQRPLPQPRVEDARTRAPQAKQPVEASRSEDMSAAAMLPDELWEILTGQPKPGSRPTAPPAPDVEDEFVEDEEALVREDVTVETRRRTYEEAVSLEELPRREVPEVVSMEGPPPSPRVRHAAFHAKVGADPAPQIAAALRPELPELRRLGELRKAVLAHTILGPPKALE